MAGNSDTLDALKEKVIISGEDHKTTEQLDLEKNVMLLRIEQRDEYQRPLKEYKKFKNGKLVIVDLVYNTKKGDISSKPSLKYKTAMCVHKKAGECTFGKDCRYAHSPEEMEMYLQCQSHLVEYYETAKGMCLDEHAEPCKNQKCPFKLRLLLRKTVFCEFYEENRCDKTEETCTYAHGPEQLKPLPKKELCWNWKKEACNLEHDQCVYAHGKGELRYEGATTDHANVGGTADATDAADVPILCPHCLLLCEQISEELFYERYCLAN